MRGNLVSAKHCNYVDKKSYVCLDKLHKVKLVKCRNRNGKRKFQDYFAHISKRGNGNSTKPLCCKYTESSSIRNAKKWLSESNLKFSFVVKKCFLCQFEIFLEMDYFCSISVEPVQVENKMWNYQCVLKKNENVLAVIAVISKCYTTVKKLQTLHDNNVFALELDVKEIQSISLLVHKMLIQFTDFKICILLIMNVKSAY